MDSTQPAATGPLLESSAPSHSLANTGNDGENVWDEERIEKALKTLKEMHIQVRLQLYMTDWFSS